MMMTNGSIKKRNPKRKESKYKPLVDALCKQSGLPDPDYEYKFNPDRKWRFDIAWPKYKIAIEIEGGIWIQGRHNRGAGMIKDMEKYNSANMLGWMLLQYTPQNLSNFVKDLKELK